MLSYAPCQPDDVAPDVRRSRSPRRLLVIALGLLAVGLSLAPQANAGSIVTSDGSKLVGNIEGNQLMLGPCDVLFTDGFTGNNTLKLVEGFARFIGALSQRPDLTAEEKEAFGPVLQFLGKNFSYEVQGGAMLLGVRGISIIAHGRSSARAITNAVKEAWEQVRHDLPAKLADAQS